MFSLKLLHLVAIFIFTFIGKVQGLVTHQVLLQLDEITHLEFNSVITVDLPEQNSLEVRVEENSLWLRAVEPIKLVLVMVREQKEQHLLYVSTEGYVVEKRKILTEQATNQSIEELLVAMSRQLLQQYLIPVPLRENSLNLIKTGIDPNVKLRFKCLEASLSCGKVLEYKPIASWQLVRIQQNNLIGDVYEITNNWYESISLKPQTVWTHGILASSFSSEQLASHKTALLVVIRTQ